MFHEKQCDSGRAHLHTALAQFRALNDRFWTALTLMNLSLCELGNISRSIELLEESLVLFRAVGGLTNVAMVLGNLGGVLMGEELDRGAAFVRESLTLSHKFGDRWNSISCIELLAEEAVVYQRPQRAVRLLGSVSSAREKIGTQSANIHEYKDGMTPPGVSARSQLSDVEYEEAWRAGAALSLDEAVAFALAEPPWTEERVGQVQGGVVRASHGLTSREMDVLRLVVDGRTNREIAECLFISVATVKRHLTTIFGKLGVTSRIEAAAFAREQRLV
jgi:non-specific serine/threonine protein kinase